MPIIFKLDGQVNSRVLEIKHDINGIVKLSSIISIFENYGISQESFEYIGFIIESETLKDDTLIYQISNDNLIIFVFTRNEEIKKKLNKIFLENEINIDNNNLDKINEEQVDKINEEQVDNNPDSDDNNSKSDDNNSKSVDNNPDSDDNNSKSVDNNPDSDDNNSKSDDNNSDSDDNNLDSDDNNSDSNDNNSDSDNNSNSDDNLEQVDTELIKPIVDKIQEELPELSQEIIDTINIKTAKLFENNDFKHLIRIYYSNPDILKTFLNFVSQGDIIKINIPVISEEKNYSVEIETLKSLGINESDDTIKQVLKLFNGHLNLSLRVLLTRSAINFDI